MPKAEQPVDLALAAVLKRERERRGESQEALAYRAGLSSGSLAAIELARASPAWPTVLSIVSALDMTLPELVEALEQQR